MQIFGAMGDVPLAVQSCGMSLKRSPTAAANVLQVAQEAEADRARRRRPSR